MISVSGQAQSEIAIDEHGKVNAAMANDLATQGKLQNDIARTLGVSVMTLHRWRKAPPGPQSEFVEIQEAGQPDRTRGGATELLNFSSRIHDCADW
jgi:hypothetical protein